jgi:predicted RNA-binding Zn-ribbon protein involved in translation (DUF1610 family)
MCKFSKLNYNDTLNRLHEFDVEKKMHNSTEKDNNNNQKEEYCTNCKKKGHISNRCSEHKCTICGLTNHYKELCFRNNKKYSGSANIS